MFLDVLRFMLCTYWYAFAVQHTVQHAPGSVLSIDSGGFAAMAALVTDNGKRILGSYLKRCRELRGWSLDQLIKRVEEVTGHRLGKSTISSLERGHTQPTWDTLSLLADVGYARLPNGHPLSVYQMFDIACELLSPDDFEVRRQDSSKPARQVRYRAAESDHEMEFAIA